VLRSTTKLFQDDVPFFILVSWSLYVSSHLHAFVSEVLRFQFPMSKLQGIFRNFPCFFSFPGSHQYELTLWELAAL